MLYRIFSKDYLKLSLASAAVLLAASSFAHAEVASIYGGSDGLCGSKGELNVASRINPIEHGTIPQVHAQNRRMVSVNIDANVETTCAKNVYEWNCVLRLF